jgi:L-fuconate dehydratase
MAQIVGFNVIDVRFPTSLQLDGSDAMNASPDYAAAYLSLELSDGTSGHGFTFTIGHGNAVQVAAIRALEPFCVGEDVGDEVGAVDRLTRRMLSASELRWLGPEKGVMHMAIGAVVNTLFDLVAKRNGKPLWRYLAEMTPEDLVSLVDFRYLSDALTPSEALAILRRRLVGKEDRIAALEAHGYPAYTSSPGWLGYDDAKLERLCREAVEEGFDQVKLKVGGTIDDDRRRCAIARKAIGDHIRLAVDANQVWDVDSAIGWIRALAPFNLAWVEEPTSPDEILGLARIRSAVRPIAIASGEHVANRVVFKQLLQANALDVLQIDASRVAGVSENLAILLLAAKFGVPVCPHAGGVGLCEVVQHLAFFDYAAVSGSLEGRRIEWIDHLHQHFLSPAFVSHGRYAAPKEPGASGEMLPESLTEFAYPHGVAWRGALSNQP